MGCPDKRITGSRLQAIRRDHFRRNPFCVRCKDAGRIKLATQLDHIVALGNGGADIESNRQGLCDDCHKDKTAEDFKFRYRRLPQRKVGVDGYPV